VHADLLVYEQPIFGGHTQQLFSADEFSGNKRITSIKNKSITHIHLAFCDLISYYNKHGWKIDTIVCDSESNLKAARIYLGQNRINLMHTPPHQHAQRVERHIRTVKDRVRTILASIPYVLPLILVYKAKYTRRLYNT
jgi:hypothetical protein